MDANLRTVKLPAGMRLDLGGFAKGWAADRVARRLGKFTPAVVDAGGDIAVSGPRRSGESSSPQPGCTQPWLVGVGHPEDARQHLAVLRIARGGVATSGRNYRRWEQDGTVQHHLIDPRTGRPAQTDVLTATVVAASVITAEAAAKAAFILGSRAGLEWLEAHPRLAGILALEDGRIFYSSRMRKFLVE
jgi:thiamine biosynthesis lipoprotein